MPGPSIARCFTFLDQRFSRSLEVDFAESLSPDVVSALKLWLALAVAVGCGSALVPNYLYVSLAMTAVSIALAVFLYAMGDRKQLHWEKVAVLYLCTLILMAPCTDQLNVTAHWVDPGEADELPTTSAVASLRTVLFFSGSLVIPVRSHLAVNLLAVAVASVLYWKYLLGCARGPSIGIEEADVTAFGCMLVVVVSGWKREQFLRGRFLGERQSKVREQDRHLMERQSLQASALAFEDAAMGLCDTVLQVDRELNIVNPPESFTAIFEQRAANRPLLELIVPADREQVQDLVHDLTQSGARCPVRTIVTLQMPSGVTLCCDAVIFATSQQHCVLGLHFNTERAARERPAQGFGQGPSQHSDLSSGSVLTYTISSKGPSTDRGPPSETNRGPPSEIVSTTTASSRVRQQSDPEGLSCHAHSIVTAMLHEKADAQPHATRPEARPRKGGQTPTQEAEVQTQRPETADKATSMRRQCRPPTMPGTPTGLALPPLQPVLRIADTQDSDETSDAASDASDSRSSVSSVSMRSSASGAEGNEAAGQCAAVLMAIEMCRSRRRACCEWHASAAVVAKLASKMRAGSCDVRWRPNSEWQCPSCFCMLTKEPDSCFVCGSPNPALQS